MLRLEGVHAFYGAGHILHGVDLAIPRAQVTAVLGRNGVGKTTTVRAIMGLVPQRGGRVWLDDHDIAGWPPHRIARAGVAYVPEGRLIFPDLTVVENIRVAERVPARQWTLARLFELFPSLAERAKNKGSQLSGGEQQMLAVARALATDPKVMLLDEPSQGLAPLIVRELARVTARLRAEGVTVLLVEQNLKFAESVADEVCMLVKGRSVYQGTLAAFQQERETLKAKYLTV
jgi:branched-chain amino acid transport system ATP-binding protein